MMDWRRYPYLIIGVLFLVSCAQYALSSSSGKNEALADYPAAHLTARGEVSLEGKVQISSNGNTKETLIFSGNKIKVQNGKARLELMLGGSLQLFDHSELTILQNHSPYLFTLSSGSVAFELDSSWGDIFFTPDFIVKTMPEDRSPKHQFKGELTVGPDGVVCLYSRIGALKVTTQDGQNFLMLPPGGSMKLHPGDLVNQPMFYSQACSCLKPFKNSWSDLSAGFRHRPARSFWGKISMALHRVAHLATFGLV